ncbi:DUF2812 domain-containing protein [Tetragenococcus solitarius]|uniref:DUF2812 domain-containing protein n=1 Tax=Tetragenococcus solitarius TaxID=71453 RepID=A0ABN3YD90_9ENTE|nr:DUF2812 domain-containing protein [Tetragenococcus solitarius]
MKKVFKFFTVDNFEKEELYLRKMAQKGWQFKNYRGFRYYFEKDKPQDTYYRIDYHASDDGDKSEYLQLFRDSGWEPIFSLPILDGEWVYFKKNNSQTGSTEIFTDASSKIQLFRKIKKRWARFALLLFICAFLPLIVGSLIFKSPFLFLFLILISGGIAVLYGKMIVNLAKKIQKLQEYG